MDEKILKTLEELAGKVGNIEKRIDKIEKELQTNMEFELLFR